MSTTIGSVTPTLIDTLSSSAIGSTFVNDKERDKSLKGRLQDISADEDDEDSSTSLEFEDLLSSLSNNQSDVNPRSRRQETVPKYSTQSTSTTSFPELPSCRKYRTYRDKDMLDAIEEVRMGNMSANQASQKYGVPLRTLYEKLKKHRKSKWERMKIC